MLVFLQDCKREQAARGTCSWVDNRAPQHLGVCQCLASWHMDGPTDMVHGKGERGRWAL